MAFSDPIAELLTNIRNAARAKHKFLDIRLSKMRVAILQILKDNGFIENFLVGKEKGMIRIFLKYNKARISVLKGLKRISKPGLRKYVNYDSLTTVFGGTGIAILSTSKGVLEGKKAKDEKVGGELLCHIW